MGLRELCSILIASGLALSCSGDSDAGADQVSVCAHRPVRMAVASSLKEIAVGITESLSSRVPSIEVELILGASSAHARQLTLGAPIDVIVSADAEIIDQLRDQRLVASDSLTEIARGRLVLLESPQRAERNGTRDPADILRHSDFQRLAVPAAAVPLGRYARRWLESRGLAEGLTGRLVTTEHARATLAAVDTGHVDFAIVYASDARLARRARLVAEIDSGQHPAIRYVAARSLNSPPCDSIGAAHGAWSEPAARAELVRSGFLAPGAGLVRTSVGPSRLPSGSARTAIQLSSRAL